MRDRIIVMDRQGEGTGFAQVHLTNWGLVDQFKKWLWARTEPAFLPDQDVPDAFMNYPWAEWHVNLFDDHQIDIQLLYELVTHNKLELLEDALQASHFQFVGDPENAGDRAYNAAHLLAALLNGELT